MGQTTITTPTRPSHGVKSLSNHVAVVTGSYTFTSNYPTGGVQFDPAAAHGSVAATLQVHLQPTAGYTFPWNAATKTLTAYHGSAEAAAATDLSTLGAVPFHALVRTT
jgi:6-phosphogluconolactonase (cycloisomerase 2 family)